MASGKIAQDIMRGEFVDLGGVRLYCYAFGSRGAGDPIVLVHGAFTSSHIWQDLLPRLPQGHRVLVLDLLGHGRSDPPNAASMTVAGHAARLALLLNVMGVERASLVGHGMGAAVCALVAATHPHRVAHLALINPTLLARDAGDAGVTGRFKRLAWLVPLWRLLSPQWLASALHAALLPSYSQRDVGARSLDVYLKTFQSRDGRASACAQLRALTVSGSDTVRALAKGALTCPTSVALGTHDPFLPPARATRLLDALRDATTNACIAQSIPGVAHVAPEEAPDRLGAIIAALLTRETR